MSQQLDLETGDVTAERTSAWRMSLAYDASSAEISVRFDDASGTCLRGDWDTLVEQVRTREPSRWQYSDYPPPLGGPLKAVVQKLKTTAAFQLFLAGFETAQLLGLVKHDWDSLLRLGPVLSDLYTGGGKRGGLYFPPEEWYERQNSEVINELLRNNKIGRLIATSDNGTRFENVYIPYATPATLLHKLTPEARSAWGELRSLYYRATGRE